MMRRALVLGYGVVIYVAFAAVFVALGAWLVNLGPLRGVDEGTPIGAGAALAIDLALIGAFGLSHSVLARPWAKRLVTRVIPVAAERSTYVLVANVSLALLMWQWRPLPDVIWHTTRALHAVQAAGVALALVSTFLTDHFDLFGLRQVWLYAQGRPYTPVPFVEHWIYTRVRHPMMLGLLLWMWAAPVMTVGHLVFAVAMTAYIAIGIAFEERGLVRALGAPYEDYRARVPALLPRLTTTRSAGFPDRRAR